MLLSAIPVKIYPPKLSEKPLFTMSKSKKALRTNTELKGGMSRASLSRIFLESQMSANSHVWTAPCWLSGRGQLTKIRRSDGCRRKTITTAAEFE